MKSFVLGVLLLAAEPAPGAPGLTFEYVSPDAPVELDVLRVCADPNSLPYSNRKKEGFENRIAEMIAAELDVPLRYVWWPQRRGFIRNTLAAGKCDLVMAVPTGMDMITATRPYYRSTYGFLSRADRNLDIRSLDDPRLASLRIGVHVIGDDYSNTPGAHALARRDIVSNVRGFSVYGDYAQPNPPARLIEAVANDSVDVAIVWGPLAGYFASRQSEPLVFTPVVPSFDPPAQAFVFSVSMGVQRGQYALRKELNRIIDRRRGDIERVLLDYGVPLLEEPGTRTGGEQ